MSLNKPAKELLVDLVNESWGTAYVHTAVVFENLEFQPYDADRNTGITIKSAVGETPLANPRNVYYDRVRLGDVAAKRLGLGVVPTIEWVAQDSTDDLLAEINTLLQTQLAAADIVVEPIPATAFPRHVVIKANPASLVYIGQFSVSLVNDVA